MPLFKQIRVDKKPTRDRFFIVKGGFLILWILAFYCAGFPSAFALENQQQGLTLQQAIAQSLNQHPELAGFIYRMQSADAYVKQAAVGQKPELALVIEDALGSGEYRNVDNAQSTLSISWILDGELLDRRVEKFQSQTSLIEIEREIKRYDIGAQTAHKFLAVIAYQERLSIAEKATEHAKNILKDIVKRVGAGRAPIADQLRAEVNLERRELEVEDIHHELKAAKRILASMWGAENFPQALGSLTIAHKLVDYSELKESINTSPDIRYFLTQDRIAESEITLAKEEAKNRLRFNAGVSRYERTEDYGFRVGVSLPLGRASRNQGRISALNAEQNRYLADAQAKEIQLTTQLFVLYEELKHSYHINESLENKIIPRLVRASEETYKAYQLGKYSYQELSVVQQEVLDARLALVDARLTAHNNSVEIERLTGLTLSQVKKNH